MANLEICCMVDCVWSLLEGIMVDILQLDQEGVCYNQGCGGIRLLCFSIKVKLSS